MRQMMARAGDVDTRETLLGLEGNPRPPTFSVPTLFPPISTRGSPSRPQPSPPRDPVNTLLSFGYGMLYREVVGAILAVGLHPAMAF